MNIGWNIETYLTLSAIVVSAAVSFLIIRTDWKRYGALFLLSAVTGNLLCFLFCGLGLYYYPYRLFPCFRMPVVVVSTSFPVAVLFGVRYSPKTWPYKIPFYWVLVHLGVFFEGWAENETQLIRYNPPWDLWDTYTWWWIFFLVFEWVGGMIVAPESRRPMDQELLRYGRVGWFILHFILIITIFIAGVYAGKTLLK